MDVDKLALAHPPQGQNGQRNEGNEDEAQGAIGVNGPAQQQAEPAKVSVAESGIRGAEGTEDTEEECRQESNDEAVDKSTERGTTAAAGGIAINACCTAGEEVRHQTGQNQRNAKGWIEPGRQDGEADKSAEEGRNESDEHCVLGIRKDDGGIQCRDRAGHHLGCDALESRHELAQDGADAKQDDGHGYAKLESLGHGLHQEIAHISGAIWKGREGFLGTGASNEEHGEDHVHQRHG